MSWRLLTLVFLLPAQLAFAKNSLDWEVWLNSAQWLIAKSNDEGQRSFETPLIKTHQVKSTGNASPDVRSYEGIEIAVNANQIFFIGEHRGFLTLFFGAPVNSSRPAEQDERLQSAIQVAQEAADDLEKRSGEQVLLPRGISLAERGFTNQIGVFTVGYVHLHEMKKEILARFMMALEHKASCIGTLTDWTSR